MCNLFFFKSKLLFKDMDEFPETCKNGQRQSPIAIDPESAVRRCYPPLEFSNYNVTYPTFMTNKAGQSRLYFLNI